MTLITWLSQHWAEGAMAFILAVTVSAWLLRGRPSAAPTNSALRKGLLLVFIFTLLLTPWVPIGIHGLSPASVLSGMLGELSSLTLACCLLQVLTAPSDKPPTRFYLPYLLAALALAWSTLSYVGPDVYRWGFLNGAVAQVGMFASLALLACWLPVQLSLALGLATVGWALGLQASTNLWDYLVDVPTALYIGVRLIRSLFLRASHV